VIMRSEILYQFHQKHTSRYFSARIIKKTELQGIVSKIKVYYETL